MTNRYALTQRARADLAEIAEHVGEVAGPMTARRVVLAFRSAFLLLAEQPLVGHERDDLTSDGNVRFWPVHSWLVAYAPEPTLTTILAIVHGARDPDVILKLMEALANEPPHEERE